MVDLSEKETREQVIDPILERVGWSKKYILEEVNPVKSNFGTKEFNFDKDNIERGTDMFIDYLLLAEDNSPAAIIEAKRTSVDVEKGEIQGRTYRSEIEKQIGKKIPIFLTNGKKWYYIDEKDRQREVPLPFSQGDLHRRAHQAEREKDPTTIKINPKIVDRSRSIEAVKVVLEHFEKGHREALVNMATGTGKTRVAMAIIDNLMRADYVRNVLFVVDRISLGNQAKESGFKEFFPGEPVCELNVEGYSGSARLYVSTVQTLMSEQKPRGRFYEKFGTGAFDLIVYDEAHRSYYDRNNDVLKYFDAIKLGLTATPRNEKGGGKNTFKLFGCDDEPTYKYDYDSAVGDDVLAPYSAEVIETKVLSLGIKGKKLSKEIKFQLEKQEEAPEDFEAPGARFEKFFTDERTNELIVSEFMDRCYKTDDLVPCKTIFFCASVKHAESLKKIFEKLYPNLAKEVRVITSDKARYMDEVRRFKKNSTPRIALSVGVLDTGIDVPEIMNLVFVKPVFSYVRFWQMLGRGTRNLNSVKHKDWLPHPEDIAKKDNFLILDFMFGDHSNVSYHELDRTREKSKSLDAKTRIFLEQVDMLEKGLDEGEKLVIESEIRKAIKAIDADSPFVLEKKGMIKKVVSKKFDLKEHVRELREEIAPLLIYSKSENSKVYSFISKCVKLFDLIKEDDRDGIGHPTGVPLGVGLSRSTSDVAKIEEKLKERVRNVWDRQLEVVRAKDEDIKRVLGDEFWEDMTFEDVDFLIREISPLMIYYEKDRKKMLRIDAPDVVLNVEKIEMKIRENPNYEYFLNENPFIKKIRDGKGVTSGELLEIERTLTSLNPAWTIENIQNIRKVDFVFFLRGLLSITDLPDPQEMIKNEFDKFVMGRNEHYNSEQLKFLRFLKEVFVRAKHIELKDFARHPLTEERPLDKFNKEQLVGIVEKCNGLRWR